MRVLILRCGGTVESAPVLNPDGRGYGLEPDDATWVKIEKSLRRRFRREQEELGMEVVVKRLFKEGIRLPDSSKIGPYRRWDIACRVFELLLEAELAGEPYDGVEVLAGTDKKYQVVSCIRYLMPSIVKALSKILGRAIKVATNMTGALDPPYNAYKDSDGSIQYERNHNETFRFNPGYDGMQNIVEGLLFLKTLIESDVYQNSPCQAPVFGSFCGEVFAAGYEKRKYRRGYHAFYSPGRTELCRINENGDVIINNNEIFHYLEASSHIPGYPLDFTSPHSKPEELSPVAAFPRMAMLKPNNYYFQRNPDQPRTLVSLHTIHDWFMYEYECALNKDGLRILILEGSGEGNFNTDDPRLPELLEQAFDKGIIVFMTGQIYSHASANPAYTAGLMPNVINLTGKSGFDVQMLSEFVMEAVRQGQIPDTNDAIIRHIATNYGDNLPDRQNRETQLPNVPYGAVHPAALPMLEKLRGSTPKRPCLIAQR